MATILQQIQFGFLKRQILSPKTADFLRWDLAMSATQRHADLFMLDPRMMSFLYAGICSSKDVEPACGVLLKIFENEPRRSINQKNLMVVIRRLIVEGEVSIAVQALKLLVEKNGVKKTLGSKYFMEAMECLATFDTNGIGWPIIKEFEKKEPELCANNTQLQKVKSNYELGELEEKNVADIDLVELAKNEEKPPENGLIQGQDRQKEALKLAPNSKLWAGPA